MQTNLLEQIHIAGRAAHAGALMLLEERAKDAHGKVPFHHKPDGTRVTDGDLRASEAIRMVLAQESPGVVIVDEEDKASYTQRSQDPFWLIDPCDGTYNYSMGGNDFCVLISWIQEGRATLGLIFFPITGDWYWGGTGLGAFESFGPPTAEGRRLEAPTPKDYLTGTHALQSKNGPLYKDLLVHAGVKAFVNAPCSGAYYRHLLLGRADVNLSREGKPSLWDVGPGAALLPETGGCATDLDGNPYDFLGSVSLAHGTLACSRLDVHVQMLERLDRAPLRASCFT